MFAFTAANTYCYYIYVSLLPPPTGLDSYDKVLKLFSVARAEFGETLSSFELMDSATVTCVENNLGLPCPVANVHPFYALVELASSRPAAGRHMENVLAKALDDSLIVDAATTDQTSGINVSTHRTRLFYFCFVYDFPLSPAFIQRKYITTNRRRLG